MKKQEIVDLYNGLSVIKDLKGVKLNYAIAKNISLLEPEVKALQKAHMSSDSFQEYEKKRVEIAEKYAKKEENGNPIIVNDNYILEDKYGFTKEVEKLNKEYKKTIDERKAQMEEVDKLLLEEVPIELHKITLDDIPNDVTTEQMKSIIKIIE